VYCGASGTMEKDGIAKINEGNQRHHVVEHLVTKLEKVNDIVVMDNFLHWCVSISIFEK